MPEVQVFRNDGAALFEEDSRTLEYIDPGVVLLYANTEAGVVCSYFEGRLGQPVQGTVECTFDNGIDLAAVRPALEAVDAPGFSVSSAPREDASSARWALDGLTEEELWLADPQHDAVRRFVETDGAHEDGRSWLPSRPFRGEGRSPANVADDLLLAGAADADVNGDSGTEGDSSRERDGDAADGDHPVCADGLPEPARGAGLDFETRSTYDAARFFAFLVDTLADTGLTVAVSKAGRVDAINDVDLVIRPDGELPPGSSVEPFPDSRERLDVQRDAVARERAREHLKEPVAALGDAYRDAGTDEAVDDDTGETVLRELLDTHLGAYSSLAVVHRWRARYRRVRIALVAAVVGVLVGVLGAEPLRLAGRRVETTARDFAATDPGVVRAAVLNAVSGAGALAVPGAAALVLVVAVVARHRSVNDRERAHRPSTARSDLRRIVLTAAAVAALLALASSAVLLWAGA